jgi:hypothetical protein
MENISKAYLPAAGHDWALPSVAVLKHLLPSPNSSEIEFSIWGERVQLHRYLLFPLSLVLP